MKMEAICSSETFVDFQRTTLHYIPEDSTLLYISLLDVNCHYIILKGLIVAVEMNAKL
jgi:hypothetical protein